MLRCNHHHITASVCTTGDKRALSSNSALFCSTNSARAYSHGFSTTQKMVTSVAPKPLPSEDSGKISVSKA